MPRLSISLFVWWNTLCCVDGFSTPRHSAGRLSFQYAQPLKSSSELAVDVSEYFSIETTQTGPANGDVHTLTIHKLPGQENRVPPKAAAVVAAVAATDDDDDDDKKEGDEEAVAAEAEATDDDDDKKEGVEEEAAVEAEATDDDDEKEVDEGEVEADEDESSEGTNGATDSDSTDTMLPITIQTGKIGRQAAGAVTMVRGDTVLYATAARDKDPKEGLGFLPLSVEHQERFSSAGLTSGGYNKRDGRPAEHEVLTCRLIDRPLRPLIDQGWRHETQLLSWVLSYDGVRSCDPLAITASATALYLSDVPLHKPVAAAMVGYDAESDTLLLNPTNEEMKNSQLQMIVAGTKDAVLMIEGAADFLPESTMIKAVKFGHDAIGVICEAVEEFGKTVGITKKLDTLEKAPEGLQEKINELMTAKVDAMYAAGGTKTTQGPVSRALKEELKVTLGEEYESGDIGNAFKDLLCRRMFERAKETGKRCDGRDLEEVRRLDMEAGWLPRTHGSAIFTRGETQVIATATLGDSGMRQKIDKLDGTLQKRFYLQYTFPPSCVGETGRVGMPGRREVGHGNLAER
jgi:polyribonucleotide nucleotidyltransferase